jgi:hypothetical protein
MVRDLLKPARAAIAWGWVTLLRRAPRAKLFPDHPPPSAPFPFIPGVSWSMVSVVKGGSLDAANRIQAMLEEQRRRFASGALFRPLASIVQRDVTIVALIAETGAIQAEHLVAIFPLSGNLYFRKSRKTQPVSLTA